MMTCSHPCAHVKVTDVSSRSPRWWFAAAVSTKEAHAQRVKVRKRRRGEDIMVDGKVFAWCIPRPL